MEVDPVCSLCRIVNESHEHLFFSCPFTVRIWAEMVWLNHIARDPLGWSGEIQWDCTASTLSNAMFKRSLACTLYHLWLERNRRIFTQSVSHKEVIVAGMVKEIRARACSSMRVKNSLQNRQICMDWGLPCSILQT
ncbi:hypothetical protein CsSME_00028270 [Camellia sinensis var. sinensis]